MPSAGFKLEISAVERLQTYALGNTATGVGRQSFGSLYKVRLFCAEFHETHERLLYYMYISNTEFHLNWLRSINMASINSFKPLCKV
jgi:hypothetical protein